MATKYRVIKVKGTKPETFIVVGIDFGQSAITSTSEAMLETEMRGYLQKAGALEKDIVAWIDQARKYPG
jgi:cephalosporin hydroxylase